MMGLVDKGINLAVEKHPVGESRQQNVEDMTSPGEMQPVGQCSQQRVEELVDRLERGVKSARLAVHGARESELALKLEESERRERIFRSELEEILRKTQAADTVSSCQVEQLSEQLTEKDKLLAELQGARDGIRQYAEGLAEDLKNASCRQLSLEEELEENVIKIETTDLQNETLRAEYRMGIVNQEAYRVCRSQEDLLTPEQTPDDAALEASFQIQRQDDRIRELQMQLEKVQAKERCSPGLAYQQELEERSRAQQQELADRCEQRMLLLENELQAAKATREASNSSRQDRNAADHEACTQTESVKPNQEHIMQLEAQLDAAKARINSLENDLGLSNAHINSLENDLSLRKVNEEQLTANLRTSHALSQSVQAQLEQAQLEAERARGACQDQQEHIETLELELHDIKGKLAKQQDPASKIETNLQLASDANNDKHEQALPCDSQLTDPEKEELLALVKDLQVQESALKQQFEESKEELRKEVQLEFHRELGELSIELTKKEVQLALLRASEAEESAEAAKLKRASEFSIELQTGRSRLEPIEGGASPEGSLLRLELGSPTLKESTESKVAHAESKVVSMQDLPAQIHETKQDSSLDMSTDEALRVRRVMEDNVYLTNQLTVLWREMSAKAAGQTQVPAGMTPPRIVRSVPGSTYQLRVAEPVQQAGTQRVFSPRRVLSPQRILSPKSRTPTALSPTVTHKAIVPVVHQADKPDQAPQLQVSNAHMQESSGSIVAPVPSSLSLKTSSTLSKATLRPRDTQDQLAISQKVVVVHSAMPAMQVVTEPRYKSIGGSMPMSTPLSPHANINFHTSLSPTMSMGTIHRRSLSPGVPIAGTFSTLRSPRANSPQPQAVISIPGSRWVSQKKRTFETAASTVTSPRAVETQPAHLGTDVSRRPTSVFMEPCAMTS